MSVFDDVKYNFTVQNTLTVKDATFSGVLTLPAGTAAAPSLQGPDGQGISFGSSTIDFNIGTAQEMSLSATALNLNGNILYGELHPFAAKTADYTLTASDKVISVDATSAETTITLPTASSIAGRCYTIKKIDSSANAVVLDGNGAETIDGAANYQINLQWQAVTVISNGTNWLVI